MAGKNSKKKPRSGTRYPRGRTRPSRGRASFRKLLWLLMLVSAAIFFEWQRSRPGPSPVDRPQAGLPLEVAVADSFIGRVIRVSDGDSIKVAVGETGAEVQVRLYGLDAPELDQPHGREARDFLSKLLLDREVRVNKQGLDQYGRVVGQVFDSGLAVNLTLVASGHAWVYEQFCREPICRQMRAEEAQARRKKLGLWNQNEPQPPWQWRQSKGGRSK